MKKIIKLTERDLNNIVKKVLREVDEENEPDVTEKIIEKMTRIDKHFFNRFVIIKNFEMLPKKFKKVFPEDRYAETYFKSYSTKGTLFLVRTPFSKDFLILLEPDRMIIADERDIYYSERDVEKLLRLNSFGVSLRELLTYIIKRKQKTQIKEPEN
jgi:hypothetical protein